MDLVQPRKPIGSLYCLDTDSKSMTLKVPHVTISNGLCWSLDHKIFYYIDTPTQGVDAFDYDIETGNITNRRTIIEIPLDLGFPDGMTIDNEGKLWIACWGGSKITRWDSETGKLLRTIAMPALKTSSVCFGGEDLSDLYVTTASTEGEAYPNGHLFRVRNLGVKGLKEFEYQG